MQSLVSVEDKKQFIQWFLNSCQLKKRESVWILNYLLNHPELLENVHFVREVKFCPRGIIMTAQCAKDTPFRFYKNHLVTTDAEKSFHDIRLNRDQPLFLQLNFKNSKQNACYAAVLEENPYLPEEFYITGQDQETAAKLLKESLYEFKKQALLEEIDQALDELDQHKFAELVQQLHQLQKPNQPKLQKQ